MGIFSSKKRTVVGTVVQRVITDNLLPNAVKTGITRAIFDKDAGSATVSEFITEELAASIGVKAERMYVYGRDHYTHGLPSGQMHAASAGRAAVQTVLDTLEGTPVLIEYSQMGPPNNLHMGWMQVISLYGYDPVTNELPVLSALKGETVYLDDLSVVVPAADVLTYRAGALDQWGTPATAGPTPARVTVNSVFGSLRPQSPVFADTAAAYEYVELDYTWQTSTPTVHLGESTLEITNHVESVQISLDGIGDDAADYFHVKYTVGGLTKFVMYQLGTGTYPTLDDLYNVPPDENGTFFPFAYFRYDKVMETADTESASYLTNKKLVKYLGLDFDATSAAIEENPDLGVVEQAMLLMAVPANTENELEQRYLFSFFENIFFNRGVTAYSGPVQGRIAGIQSRDPNISRNALVVQDLRFKMTINDSGIFKKLIPGTIGSPGMYASGIGTESYNDTVVDYDSYTETLVPRQRKYHYFRKQVTAGLYEEITVADLEVKYFVLGDNATIADEEDNILLIPIDRSVTELWSIPDREMLYSRSLHYIFNSLEIITIKWYQTGLFQVLVVIVALVVAYYTGQFELVASALAGNTAAAIVLLKGLVISFAIAQGLKLVTKAIGGELALVIAAVAVVVAGVQAFNAGSIAGAPWASDLLTLANGLSKAVVASIQEEFRNLLGQATEFNFLADAAKTSLEAANKLLENNSYLGPFVIFGEKPDEFYNRTIHSGNIGVLGISAISNYVDTALRLPRLDETLGESAYV